MWSHSHSLAFDVSVWEIFGALLRGGRLVVVPEAIAGRRTTFTPCWSPNGSACSPKPLRRSGHCPRRVGVDGVGGRW
ncbi:linear gramicidin synthetase subunit D domain protein [Mycobacterium xenopi 4042]|uniref:Linear gramicidin synthetase subunit D domain protein n=1 Tax=Mycobacterium xenopi 4042 TaxID=1299334 RepID=X7YKS5_MYCXE|nr:linear gramicidin synthetase subunit D domain protein [Mycobacterium xenopi 4042]